MSEQPVEADQGCADSMAPEAELMKWLAGVFDARDVGRTERMVVALRSLSQAGERKRVEDMLALSREGILQLTREAWRMLQEKHPSAAEMHIHPPGSGPTPTAEQHTVRSSRCPTYLLSGPRSSRRGQGNEEACQSETFGSPYGGSFRGVETPSTADSPMPASRESSIAWSEATSITNPAVTDRWLSVSGVEDVRNLLPEDALFTYCHRDDWELQYMLTGMFEEIPICLESGTTYDLIQLLQGARRRAIEWTVRRWWSSYGEKVATSS
jgi:hypothetical protein